MLEGRYENMNFSLFVAKRLVLDKKNFSSMIIRIGIAAVAVSLAVMIIAVGIMVGYKKEITAKITGFNSHIVISALDFNESFEAQPISSQQEFIEEIEALPEVENVQVYAQKAGIIKTANAIEGIILKGVGTDFNWNFLESSIVKGHKPHLSDTGQSEEILVSQYTADKLLLDTGMKINIFFLQDRNHPVRIRRLKISGIFETGLEDYDKSFAITDINQIRRLYNWGAAHTEGFEVKLVNFNTLDASTEKVKSIVGPMLRVLNAKDIKPQIFDWLGLLDINVLIILCLMTVVAVINMITALLILILERTNMIGLLKAMGSKNVQIRNIFLWKAAYLIFQGLLIGNTVALGFGYLQQQTGFIKLNPQNYFLTEVPFDINAFYILAINAATFLLCLLVMLLPTRMVSKVNPVKAIRFD